MSILSTSSKLIKVGQDYIAGSGISIDDHVISVTGEFGKTYSAGNNVDIYEQDEQLYISSKDWEQDIANASANAYNEAVAQIPDPFDPSYLSAQIDNKLNSSDFTTWQNGQYTTDLQTIEGQINNKLDTSSFSDVSGSFLTAHQSLEGYAKEDWVTAQGYITGVDLSNYYTKDETSGKEELAQAFADIPVGDPEVNAYVTDNSATINGTTDLVQNSSGLWNDVAVYQSNSANYLTAHQDISYKLDESAFANVSGTFLTAHQSLDGYATVEDVESATSGLFPSSAVSQLANSIMNSVIGNTITYNSKPSDNAIEANGTSLVNVGQIFGSPNSQFYITPSSVLQVPNIITANTLGLTANGISAYSDSAWGGFSANGITAGPIATFAIQGQGESLTEIYENGFLFSSVNTAIGTARLTQAPGNAFVHIGSPKFEAKNISGAGFSIEGSGARGYDENGNVIWDTSKPAKLIGWSNYQGTAIDPRANGINGGIIATVYPDMIPNTMMISSAPYSYMNGGGIYACNTDGTKLSVDAQQRSITLDFPGMSAVAQMNPGDVSYTKYNNTISANEIWSLTGSVQKREIEYDADTSAITAIAGSAIGGGGVTGEFVPQSAFDELKASYDALSSLFATYSGQWLLPNEGEE